MTLNDGDVVRFDYVLYVDGQEKPLETSLVETAQEHGILDPQKHYHPLTITLGGRQIIPGLEKVLVEKGAKGESFSVELAPADAYGERDAAKIKDIPMAHFRKQNVKPEVGLILNFDNQRAVITRVAGGRVRLDMNHDLAGKTLRYDITVTDVITDETGKLDAVMETLFPMGGHKLTVSDDEIVLDLPDQAKFDQSWPMHKFRVLTQLRQAVGLDRAIKLVETYPPLKAEADEEE